VIFGLHQDFLRVSKIHCNVIPSPGEKESRIEKRFFSNVELLPIEDSNEEKSLSYTKSKDLLFQSCLVSFQDTLPDYLISSGSKAPDDVTTFVHSPQMSNLRKNTRIYPFIRFE
jgi:hypothetical protein